MGAIGWLVVYCVLILIFSLFGGYLPFLGRVTHARLQFYLSASAGVMLGAAFFHVMPEAMEMSGAAFGWWMSLAVVGLFCIERFIAPHSHELDGGHHHQPAPGTLEKDHDHSHSDGGKHEHDHHSGHDHGHDHSLPQEERAAAPAVAGWMAVLGLTIHTFMNGVGLAGAALTGDAHNTVAGLSIPGLAMFLAIVLHKPADALAISMVLSRKGARGQKIALVQFGFAMMVPVGVGAFYLTRGAIAGNMETQLTGAALAFSAGTFLFIALSDLLPEVQFHKHDRIPLFLTLALGVIFMGGIALLEDHGGHNHGGPESHQGDHDHHHPGHGDDHDDDHDRGAGERD